MVIHSNDENIIMKFALEKPAFRILVNTVSALGAVGFTNHLDPSLTLGPGTLGGSIVSINVTAAHLINIKKLTYESLPLNDKDGKKIDLGNITFGSKIGNSSRQKNWMEEIDERIKLKAGNKVYSEKGEFINAGKKDQTVYGSGISGDEIDSIIKNFRL
jgi:acetaldehyde dehydrogenase (acetylating)